eukprot:TRINITY_DN8774_c0_g1_i2.p1 TRINITY_DN8774_c0_g1~~TRINITY_DN8774_c0_g1_i2.p1  ORF type:complete len:248 (-),score=22.65 TRINITY_DN8774_c0_g1_i2:161-904(-)
MSTKSVSQEGNWICKRCGNENWASRQFCNMRKCGAQRNNDSEGNWQCMKCGNDNYPSRMRCNMRSCGAPRPPPNTMTPFSVLPPAYTWQTPTDSYNTSQDNQAYQFPVSPFYPFYGFPYLSPYPVETSGKRSFHTFSGSRVPESPSRKKHKTGQFTSEEDTDWTCAACGNLNFACRKVCNMRRCQQPRPENTKLWKCTSCGNLNFASRQKCNMKKCQAARPVPETGMETEMETGATITREQIEKDGQ